ncbi:MAG TPA: rhodanese-like domain-containing protein [Pantanalinema sp.]
MSIWTVLALAAAAAFVYTRMQGGNRMSQATIKEKIAAGATVLDVRTKDEFRSGAYPGAINIPLQELQGRLGELAKDKPVIVYCAAGGRSAAAASAMKQAGFAEVLNAGGLGQMPR